MPSGIKIKCKKRFGQFLIRQQPYCIINDTETKHLRWNEESFIPLQPNISYKITIEFTYSGKPCGSASIDMQVKPKETQIYEYKTPRVMSASGEITRKR